MVTRRDRITSYSSFTEGRGVQRPVSQRLACPRHQSDFRDDILYLKEPAYRSPISLKRSLKHRSGGHIRTMTKWPVIYPTASVKSMSAGRERVINDRSARQGGQRSTYEPTIVALSSRECVSSIRSKTTRSDRACRRRSQSKYRTPTKHRRAIARRWQWPDYFIMIADIS